MGKKKADKILGMSQDRADMLSDMLDKLDKMIDAAAGQLTDDIVKIFLDVLNTENGTVLTNEENLKKIALIDKAYRNFQEEQGLSIIANFVTDLNAINDENLKYYRTLSDAQIRPGDIKNIINSRIGIDDEGNPIKGGYIKSLMDDTSVAQDIKKYAYQKVMSGTGFNDLSKGLKNLVAGSDNTGTFKSYYRNFAYDTYTQIDRLNATLYAEKLNLQYFIYQGTRRAGSRFFCLQRKGKVFSTEEAQEWVKLIGKSTTVNTEKGSRKVLIGPIVEDAATYNPVIDMGGYGCVDVASYISEDIAFALRPELKNRITVSEDYNAVHEGAGGAKVYVHNDADPADVKDNMVSAKLLADNGEPVKIRKHVNVKGVKNPEIELRGGKLGDFKSVKPDSKLGTGINSAIKNASKQGAEIPVIKISRSNYSKSDVIRTLNGALNGRNKNISEVWLMYGKTLIKLTRDEILSKDYYDRLP